jgi:hypothetical protein
LTKQIFEGFHDSKNLHDSDNLEDLSRTLFRIHAVCNRVLMLRSHWWTRLYPNRE